MKILVVAATELEIAGFRAADPKTEVLITGAGIAATVYTLTKKLSTEKFDLVIQAGIGGQFSEYDPQVKTVAVCADCFADSGAAEVTGFRNLFDMGLADADRFPFHAGKLINPDVSNYGLEVLDAITVSAISADADVNKAFRVKYDAAIESMEGAAFHFVCLQERVKFLQLRAVSNRVGERDKTKWRMKDAIIDLHQTLHRIIKQQHE